MGRTIQWYCQGEFHCHRSSSGHTLRNAFTLFTHSWQISQLWGAAVDGELLCSFSTWAMGIRAFIAGL